MNQQQALKLWSELKQAFARIDLLVPQIIENRAWEPLGYDSFIEAWSAQLGDIDVSKAFLPAVVYAMYDTGATVDEVAYAVHGVGVRTAEVIKRQKRNGVPPRVPQRLFVNISVDPLALAAIYRLILVPQPFNVWRLLRNGLVDR